jgi:hypothetical protein
MEIRTIGALRTIAKWEELLDSLPVHAEGPEGLGRMWENEEAPRHASQDPLMKEGWRLAVVRGVEFVIGDAGDVTEWIEVSAAESATGKPYTLLRIDRTAVHLHDVKVKDGKVVGDVQVCARVFWPKGADKRHDDGKSRAWRNYLLFVDIFPTKEEVTQTLEVYPEGSERSELIMLGETDSLETEVSDDVWEELLVIAWATRSANWKPATSKGASTGSDQLLFFVPKTE